MNSRYEGNNIFYKYSYTSCLLIEKKNIKDKKLNSGKNFNKDKKESRINKNSKSNVSENKNTILSKNNNEIGKYQIDKSNKIYNISKNTYNNLNISLKMNGSLIFNK